MLYYALIVLQINCSLAGLPPPCSHMSLSFYIWFGKPLYMPRVSLEISFLSGWLSSVQWFSCYLCAKQPSLICLIRLGYPHTYLSKWMLVLTYNLSCSSVERDLILEGIVWGLIKSTDRQDPHRHRSVCCRAGLFSLWLKQRQVSLAFQGGSVSRRTTALQLYSSKAVCVWHQFIL